MMMTATTWVSQVLSDAEHIAMPKRLVRVPLTPAAERTPASPAPIVHSFKFFAGQPPSREASRAATPVPADDMAYFAAPAGRPAVRSPSLRSAHSFSYSEAASVPPSPSVSPPPMTADRGTTLPPSRPYSVMSEASENSFRSDSYWFDDGSVVLKVNSIVYNVHKSIFRLHSEYFRNALQVNGARSPDDVGTIANPCVLQFRNDDFETFLSVIYPASHGSSPNFSANQWLAILSVATELKFKAIRSAAIEHLTDVLDEIDRIRFGRVHGIWDWLREPYRLLCERAESLTLEEGNRLGMEDVIEIACKRELLARGACWEDFPAIA